MKYNGLLLTFPKEIKYFLATFIVVLSFGYFTGLLFVNQTETTNPSGIEENYLGNEEDIEANVMKFKKGEREMLTIIHTHILSMSFIFFLLGGVMLLTKLPTTFKMFLIIEPFFSILLTFGGIYFMWAGVIWMKYVVMISGVFMTLIFTTSVLIALYQLLIKKNNNS
ncbi:hypothetical protein BC962_2901 [Gillisia mitskevichiae]|uniref:Uncharacterized protein n=1 Tax=Gillisia mitskevichiae TaxID=270921 RepID=A0A495NZT8_9FLAO|nr:hypothetical protein [Gillisia mitskevichiae]RKS43346.1 hypothetical protein BC962_2901 [Gillisia mitskevichiae]